MHLLQLLCSFNFGRFTNCFTPENANIEYPKTQGMCRPTIGFTISPWICMFRLLDIGVWRVYKCQIKLFTSATINIPSSTPLCGITNNRSCILVWKSGPPSFHVLKCTKGIGLFIISKIEKFTSSTCVLYDTLWGKEHISVRQAREVFSWKVLENNQSRLISTQNVSILHTNWLWWHFEWVWIHFRPN